MFVCAIMWGRVWVEGRKPEGSMRGEKNVLRKRVGEGDGTWHADEAVETELWDRRGQTDRLRRQERGGRRIGQSNL